MRTEVYSWRVSTEIKTDLEREARLRNTSVAAVLELAVREWLQKTATAGAEDEEQQRRLHEAADRCLGTIKGNDPGRSENVRQLVRERLRRKYAR
jgi:hypothetical protein